MLRVTEHQTFFCENETILTEFSNTVNFKGVKKIFTQINMTTLLEDSKVVLTFFGPGLEVL